MCSSDLSEFPGALQVAKEWKWNGGLPNIDLESSLLSACSPLQDAGETSLKKKILDLFSEHFGRETSQKGSEGIISEQRWPNVVWSLP